MRLRIATQNVGKLKEFQSLLAPLGIEALGVSDLDGFDVDEDGDTFAANAEKKAHALFERSHEAALADDSGLVVDALGGAPGVHSARYAGVEGPTKDAANRQKLLAALKDVPDAKRTARFICVLAYVRPGVPTEFFSGKLEGVITREERGEHGFGYDKIFLVSAFNRTLAELDSAQKNAISHRGHATQAFLQAQKGR